MTRGREQNGLPTAVQALDSKLQSWLDSYGQFRKVQEGREQERKRELDAFLEQARKERTAFEKSLEEIYRTACRKILPCAVRRLRTLGAPGALIYEDSSEDVIVTDQGNGDTYVTTVRYTLHPDAHVAYELHGAWEHSGSSHDRKTEKKRMPVKDFLTGLRYSPPSTRCGFSLDRPLSPNTIGLAYQGFMRIATAKDLEGLTVS
jgi:hypothetical protein